ncbi:MAG: MBL fold metallo-hydrolase [Bryobacterales bacterium]|nr:MBL fold metallo-hydrolase [Bryobacteraceae bacterium]MDW8130286.1 MBL fold metallo-hydrolase [Bryobacterales bacterium]
MRALGLGLLCAGLAWAAPRELAIYFVDVEGGQATLVVSPQGESLLVDAGWPGFEGRDARRIQAAARHAGVRQIDYLLMTHYHLDHVGGVEPLLDYVPVRCFVDHGENTESGKNADALSESYRRALARGRRLVVKPGGRIPLRGVEVVVVTARGDLIARSLPGGGATNPHCEGAERKQDDPTENARSVGFLLRYGKFRFLNLADLTWNKELELACPVNRIGSVDVFLVNHHGLNLSNAPPLVRAIRPRVAVMSNGAKKGGSPEVLRLLRSLPELEDLWQLHLSLNATREENAPEARIANLETTCQGHWILLRAGRDGSFSVTNGRTGETVRYSAR